MKLVSQALIIIGFLTVLFAIPAHAQTVFPNKGGTGATTSPAIGQVLVGCLNAQGQAVYCPKATSSLGFGSLDTSGFLSLATWYATTTDALDEGITNLIPNLINRASRRTVKSRKPGDNSW